MCPTSLAPVARRTVARLGMTPWRVYDLRGTAATVMRAAGISRFDVERVLDHADHSVGGRYDQYDCLDEKRSALYRLGEEVESAVAGQRAERATIAGGAS